MFEYEREHMDNNKNKEGCIEADSILLLLSVNMFLFYNHSFHR